mmetsp:Transcript_23903/g.94819  ORF Transcript_23903/g.94819 Transcript_23903/m.94819 type:complete len:306 (-) Transcript_23903:190-1107(-)
MTRVRCTRHAVVSRRRAAALRRRRRFTRRRDALMIIILCDRHNGAPIIDLCRCPEQAERLEEALRDEAEPEAREREDAGGRGGVDEELDGRDARDELGGVRPPEVGDPSPEPHGKDDEAARDVGDPEADAVRRDERAVRGFSFAREELDGHDGVEEGRRAFGERGEAAEELALPRREEAVAETEGRHDMVREDLEPLVGRRVRGVEAHRRELDEGVERRFGEIQRETPARRGRRAEPPLAVRRARRERRPAHREPRECRHRDGVRAEEESVHRLELVRHRQLRGPGGLRGVLCARVLRGGAISLF